MRIYMLLICLVTLQGSAQVHVAGFDAYIDSNYKPGEPGGVVLIAERGKILYERAFGMANLELGVPMQRDMVFSIASVTKQFTAVGILMQVQAGKLKLEDTVGKYLPNMPKHLLGITIEQLLTHTAGVPNAKNINSLLIAGKGWLSATQILETFKEQPLDFVPGTAWAYSNAGYQLLGYILELVNKEPYPEWMDANLLKASGMTHSLYGLDVAIVPKRAAPYIYARRGIENAVNGNPQVAYAAGAVQSTAQDLLSWYRTLLSGKLIGKELLGKAWTRSKRSNGVENDYGYGWFVGELQGEKIVEHGGNMGGFMSHVLYIPERDLLVVVLFNFRGKLPELLASELAARVIQKPLNIRALTVTPEELQTYTGTFRNTQGILYTIGIENGKLYYQKAGANKWTLYPYAKDKVFFDNTSTLGEINRDPAGRITGFSMQTRTGMSKFSLDAVKQD